MPKDGAMPVGSTGEPLLHDSNRIGEDQTLTRPEQCRRRLRGAYEKLEKAILESPPETPVNIYVLTERFINEMLPTVHAYRRWRDTQPAP